MRKHKFREVDSGVVPKTHNSCRLNATLTHTKVLPSIWHAHIKTETRRRNVNRRRFMYTRCPFIERDERTNKLNVRQEWNIEGGRFGLTTCSDV